MKNKYRFLIAAAALALVALASQARADAPSACCSSSSCASDGIAASPKGRAMLEERCKSRCAAPQVAGTRSTVIPQTAFAGSPRTQQMLAEKPRATSAEEGTQVIG